MAQYINKDAAIVAIDKIINGLKKKCNPDPLGTMEECLTAAEIESLNLVKKGFNALEAKEVGEEPVSFVIPRSTQADWEEVKRNTEKYYSLHREAFVTHWVRLAAEQLTSYNFVCNLGKLPKKLTREKATFLTLKLIVREPRPFVEFLIGGCTQIHRIEIVGNGTKKLPYRAEWRNDYYQ